MTSPSTALVAVVAGGLAIIVLRLAVRTQRGVLDWKSEGPTLAGFLVVIVSLIAVDAAGPTARQLIPPLVILATGIGLAARDWGRVGPVRLQALGYASIVGGLLLLVGALAMVLAGQT